LAKVQSCLDLSPTLPPSLDKWHPKLEAINQASYDVRTFLPPTFLCVYFVLIIFIYFIFIEMYKFDFF